MTIYPNLNQILIERGISIADLAEIIGVDEAIADQKMQGLLPWKLHEAINICIHLKTSDINFLFLQLDTNT